MSDRVGVMSQGKLQQVANPREIYNNPVNGFVAAFVGENNIFNGELLTVNKGEGKFKTASGVFDVTVGDGVGKSTPCKRYIRPEYCLLSSKIKPGGINSIDSPSFSFGYSCPICCASKFSAYSATLIRISVVVA